MPVTASVSAPADLTAEVAAARAELDHAVQLAGLQNDPLGHAYRAQSTVIGLFPELVARMDAARMPLSDDDMRKLERTLASGVVGQVGRAVRVMDKRNVLAAAGMLVVTLAIGAGAGYWYRGDAPVFAGVRAGVDRCDDHPDGSRICWIPIFEKLPAQKAN